MVAGAVLAEPVPMLPCRGELSYMALALPRVPAAYRCIATDGGGGGPGGP